MQTKWIVDEYLAEKSPNLLSSLKKYKTPYHLTSWKNDKTDYGSFNPDTEPVVLYGSIPFCRSCPKHYTPGAWGLLPSTNYSTYSSYWPSKHFLNNNHMFLTYTQVLERAFKIYPNGFFLRPNSGMKTFAGQRIKKPSRFRKTFPS